MIRSSLKIPCRHLLQITDKEASCIDERGTVGSPVFPSGEQITRIRPDDRVLFLSPSVFQPLDGAHFDFISGESPYICYDDGKEGL